MRHTRGRNGLEVSVSDRTEAARQRVDEVIKQQVQDLSQRINLHFLPAVAGVTTAYLYNEPALRERFGRLREKQADTVSLTPREQCRTRRDGGRVGPLVLSHFTPADDSAVTDSTLLTARAHFDGEVIVGNDLLVV